MGILAVLLALVLGAAHAALPGHGKTVMAAYLAGSQGRPRDAIAVGATVTATHTGGVLALGLLLTTTAGIAGEAVLSWLGVASGTLVTAIGAATLLTTLRRRHREHRRHLPDNAQQDHDHGPHNHPDNAQHDHAHGPQRHNNEPHDHDHGPHNHPDNAQYDHAHGPQRHNNEPHDHDHGPHNHPDNAQHDHAHGPQRHNNGPHDHDHGPQHHHDSPLHGNGRHHHGHGHHGPGRWGLAGMGIAGGLVPSPTALVVLLGAAALGHTVFGVLLVLAYGLGMAATLTAAGLLLVRVRDRLGDRFRLAARWRTAGPTATAAFIVVVGLGLAGRALAGLA
ncbi:hypothetical protein Asp14428_10100 [Actinoplanes sp. NBRC 14428]|nr:hypothetical protein Asp14428_10100 [Actinoplanes sp. NBRC 14428]